jgi:hypothetical protein
MTRYLLLGTLLACLSTIMIKIWWPRSGSYWHFLAVKQQQDDINHRQSILSRHHQKLTQALAALKKHQGRDEGYIRYHYNWVLPNETLVQFDD